MKAIAHILFALLLLAALAGGCRRAPSEGERALIALDSLIATNPDSALAQLLAIDTAALDEPCRAYRALLAAQARYKAYVRATSAPTSPAPGVTTGTAAPMTAASAPCSTAEPWPRNSNTMFKLFSTTK